MQKYPQNNEGVSLGFLCPIEQGPATLRLNRRYEVGYLTRRADRRRAIEFSQSVQQRYPASYI